MMMIHENTRLVVVFRLKLHIYASNNLTLWYSVVPQRISYKELSFITFISEI